MIKLAVFNSDEEYQKNDDTVNDFDAVFVLKSDDKIKSSIMQYLESERDLLERDDHIELEFVEGRKKLSPEQILYVESSLHKVVFHVLAEGGRTYCLSRYDKLDKVEEELGKFGFMRIHQSYLVNKYMVSEIDRYFVKLINGEEVNVSKKYYQRVKEYFSNKIL